MRAPVSLGESARELVDRLGKLTVSEPVMTRAETKGMGAGEWTAVQWVRPAVLCEVAFTEWTDDGRIRHPSFQGLREDKNATEVKQEQPAHVSAISKSKPQSKAGALIAAGITITHPDRVISETGQITKGELAEYHAAVAPFMLPRIVRRPLSLLRCPSGIDGGGCFYQRSPGRGLGKDVHPFEFRHKGKRYEYLYIENEKGLLEVIQMGAIKFIRGGLSTMRRIILTASSLTDPGPDVPLKLKPRETPTTARERDRVLKCTGGKDTSLRRRRKGRPRLAVKTFDSRADVVSERPRCTPR